MRVLLIATNKVITPRPALPIGMAQISAVLKANHHEVFCLDLCWREKDHIAIIQEIKRVNPDIIGLSVRNLDNLTFLEPQFYASQLNRIVKCCNKYSNAKILIGGTGFSVCPDGLMDYLKPDYGIAGEGDRAIVQLLQYLEKGEGNISEISGLHYFENGILKRNPIQCSFDFDDILMPDRTIYHPKYYDEYLTPATEGQKVLSAFETIESRRGCDLKCSYCIIKRTQGNKVRTKSPEIVVEEMKRIRIEKPMVSEIEFADATFNYPLDYAMEVCETIIKSGLKIKWFCQLSPKYVNQELIDLLEKSGCYRVELGTDSFSDIGLDLFRKEFDFARVREVDQMLSKSSINFTHCVFFGCPGETEDHFIQALENAKLLNPDQVFVNLGIRIYEKTYLHQIAIEKGVIAKNRNTIIPTFYIEPDVLNKPHLLDMLDQMVKSNKNWYLWWGLAGTKLRDRVAESLRIIDRIENDFNYELKNLKQKVAV